VIIFLNGPFSVGKTTVADILVERIPGALLYDPELVGSLLQHHILKGIEPPKDFQDIPFWPALTLELTRLLIETYRRPLVIPMSIWKRQRAEEIRQGLAEIDPDLTWIQLTASRATLLQRIHARTDVFNDDRSWWLDHLESGLAMAEDPTFGFPVSTDGRDPETVVGAILDHGGG